MARCLQAGAAAATIRFFPDYCQNSRIDHEHESCGSFDLLSGGEYITKQRDGFNNYNMMLATARSSATWRDTSPTRRRRPAPPLEAALNGRQRRGMTRWAAGRCGMVCSWPALTIAARGVTGVCCRDRGYDRRQYNASAPQGWGSINGCNRRFPFAGIFARIESGDLPTTAEASTGNWNKREWFTTTGAITVAGQTGSWNTRSGNPESVRHQPASFGCCRVRRGSLSNATERQSGTSDWELYSNLQIDADAQPRPNFSRCWSGERQAFTKSTTNLVQSSAGQNFDCAEVNASMVCFMRNWPAAFTGVTYPASGATTQYVSDLAPNTNYAISGTGAPASATTDTAGVLIFAAAGTGNITVGTSNAPALQSITVTPSSVTLSALGTQQYAATCGYSDGSSSSCTSSVSWASSTTGVVTINSSGMATGVAQGSANIIATSGSIQGQAAVTVPTATLQTIAVTPGTVTMQVGTVQQFKATGTYSDSSTTDVTNQVSWTSSNPVVVASTAAGLASMASQGSASIIASSGSIQGQANVTVAASTAPSFSPAAGTYTSAQTVTISTTASPATIYYTTNGSTPTTSSAVYSGPITVSASETLEAIAVIRGDSPSAVGSATYTITLPRRLRRPSARRPEPTRRHRRSPSARRRLRRTIYYTTNGSTPTTSSPVYSGPITVSATETVEAIAVPPAIRPARWVRQRTPSPWQQRRQPSAQRPGRTLRRRR